MRPECENGTTVAVLSPVNYKGDICHTHGRVWLAFAWPAWFQGHLAQGRRTLDRRETRIAALKNLLKERIVILDGAMGTMIQAQQLDEAAFRGSQFLKHPRDLRGNFDVLNITQPGIVQAIQRQYLEAGADIIKTNTFNSNGISALDYGLEHHIQELNVAGAKIARAVADEYEAAHPGQYRLVAGSMGPTNRTASMSQDVNSPASRGVTFDKLREVYYEQARGLVEGGADILLLETIFDTLNAKAALFRASTNISTPPDSACRSWFPSPSPTRADARFPARRSKRFGFRFRTWTC